MEVSVTIDVNFGEQGYSHVVKVNKESLDRIKFNISPSGPQEVDHFKALAAALCTILEDLTAANYISDFQK